MKIKVDLELLLYLLGFDSDAVLILWQTMLSNKSEEERTNFIEGVIRYMINSADLDEE